MEKKSIEITNAEIIKLYDELNGVTTPNTGEKIGLGLLDAKMLAVAKYWIGELNSVITEEKTKVTNFKNELIKKYGTYHEDGRISIPEFIDQAGVMVQNDNYINFIKDFSEILNCVKTIDYYPIDIKYLEFETDVDLKVFSKFIKK